MEEEDKKAERDLEILKKYHKKETKDVKYIFLTILLLVAFDLHSEISYGVCLS